VLQYAIYTPGFVYVTNCKVKTAGWGEQVAMYIPDNGTERKGLKKLSIINVKVTHYQHD
jgi:hypothetical protein